MGRRQNMDAAKISDFGIRGESDIRINANSNITSQSGIGVIMSLKSRTGLMDSSSLPNWNVLVPIHAQKYGATKSRF